LRFLFINLSLIYIYL